VSRYHLFVLCFYFSATLVGADVEVRTLIVEDIERRYLLSVPVGIAPDDGWPLVLMLHGGGGNPESFQALSQMDVVGEREGFITLYGDALAGGWTAGVGADPTGQAELPYLDAVLQDVADQHPVNSERRFVAGHSNGGEMAYLLVRNRPYTFAGLATVNSPVIEGSLEGILGQATFVMLFYGTADPLVPINGGPVGNGERIGLPAATVIDWWKTNLRVPASPSVIMPLPDIEDDGTTTTLTEFSPGTGGVALRVLIISNGGHGWPGSPGGLPPSVIGITAQDFEASEEIWNYFQDKILIPGQAHGIAIY
jgi:polyhydroxybutyrate depolymerase